MISTIVVLVLALVGTIVYSLIKLEVFAPSLAEQVAKVEENPDGWWLGPKFEGQPITHAEPAGGTRVNDLGYGTCQRFGNKLDP